MNRIASSSSLGGYSVWGTTGSGCKRFPHLHLCPTLVLPKVYLVGVFDYIHTVEVRVPFFFSTASRFG